MTMTMTGGSDEVTVTHTVSLAWGQLPDSVVANGRRRNTEVPSGAPTYE